MAAQVTHLLEEQRSRMRHLVAVIGRDDLHSALVQAEADRDRVTFSPEAQADMARHNITAEHVEAVIAYPSKRRRRPKDFAIELTRDIGSRTPPRRGRRPGSRFRPALRQERRLAGTAASRPPDPSRRAFAPIPPQPIDRLNSIRTNPKEHSMSDSTRTLRGRAPDLA